MKQFILTSILTASFLLSYAASPVKAIFTFKNYSESDMSVIIQVYDKKNNLMGNSSYPIDKASKDPNSNVITPFTAKPIEIKCFQGGLIKMKYKAGSSGAEYTIDPVDVPKSKDNLIRTFDLNGFTNYSANNDKARFIELGNQLNLTGVKEFSRLVDIVPQLGTLVVGKLKDNKLTNVDFIPVTTVKFEFSTPNTIQESKLTEKSVMTDLSVTIPIYGSIASSMVNDEVHSVRYNVSYYTYNNSTQISSIVNSFNTEEKKSLLANLRLLDKDMKIYILRKFDVLEDATFAVTGGTKIEIKGSASIAAVSTLSGSYIFNAQESKTISIPSKAYNIVYDEWMSVDELINKLNAALTAPLILPPDGLDATKFMKIDVLQLK
jgi:hypothetical protein